MLGSISVLACVPRPAPHGVLHAQPYEPLVLPAPACRHRRLLRARFAVGARRPDPTRRLHVAPRRHALPGGRRQPGEVCTAGPGSPLPCCTAASGVGLLAGLLASLPHCRPNMEPRCAARPVPKACAARWHSARPVWASCPRTVASLGAARHSLPAHTPAPAPCGLLCCCGGRQATVRRSMRLPPPPPQLDTTLTSQDGTVVVPPPEELPPAGVPTDSDATLLGCIIAEHVLMAGSEVATLDGLESAEDCCRACRNATRCNLYKCGRGACGRCHPACVRPHHATLPPHRPAPVLRAAAVLPSRTPAARDAAARRPAQGCALRSGQAVPVQRVIHAAAALVPHIPTLLNPSCSYCGLAGGCSYTMGPRMRALAGGQCEWPGCPGCRGELRAALPAARPRAPRRCRGVLATWHGGACPAARRAHQPAPASMPWGSGHRALPCGVCAARPTRCYPARRFRPRPARLQASCCTATRWGHPTGSLRQSLPREPTCPSQEAPRWRCRRRRCRATTRCPGATSLPSPAAPSTAASQSCERARGGGAGSPPLRSCGPGPSAGLPADPACACGLLCEGLPGGWPAVNLRKS